MRFVRYVKFKVSQDLVYYRKMGPVFIMRHLQSIGRKCLGAMNLDVLFLCPSHQCNADCIHCYEKYEGKKNVGLSTEEIKRVIGDFHRLGGRFIQLCSGEFVMRDDAIEIIKYIRSCNIIPWMTSNGILLDKAKIDELKDAGLVGLNVSIDSADPDRHDALRGVPGCLEKACDALRYAKTKGIITEIWTYVTKTNFNELEGIGRLGRDLGVVRTFVFFPLLSGHLFDKPEENLTFEEREAFRQKFNSRNDIVLEFPTEKSLCLGGGKQHICVMPTGDVTFCPPFPYSYGNIRIDSLSRRVPGKFYLSIKFLSARFCM